MGFVRSQPVEAACITGQTMYVDGGLTLYPDFRNAWSSRERPTPASQPRREKST